MATRRPRTSCEPCRVGRIGCDAALRRPAACSNCVRRGKVCNTQQNVAPIGAPRTPHSERAPEHHDETFHGGFASPTASQMPITPSSTSFSSLESLANRRLQAESLKDLLWNTYISVFEIRFAIWLGDSCCPYLELTPKPKASITRLILELDDYEARQRPPSQLYQGDMSSSFHVAESADEQHILNDALRNAIYAYSVRWLPFRAAYEAHGASGEDALEKEQSIRSQLWYRAKGSILQILTRPSYRSILALLLFTLTELPNGSEDSGFIRLCNQAMFGHLHDLRTPIQWRVNHPESQSFGSFLSPIATDGCLLAGQLGNLGGPHKHTRDQIHWLLVVASCTRSLIQRLPTASVFSQGTGDHELWDYVRQRTTIFDQSFRRLGGSAAPLPQDVVEVVLQHASACKTMHLAVVNHLSCLLIQNDSSARNDTSRCLVADSQRFHEVFDALLAMCARDYIMLSPHTQLNYLLLIAHYNLGTLILADMVDALEDPPEGIRSPAFSRLHACQAVVNALSLSLNCDRFSSNDSAFGHKLLLDPAPELMVEVLLRTGNAILILHANQELASYVAQAMLSVVLSALDILSRISRNASIVRSLLWQKTKARSLKVVEEQVNLSLRTLPENLLSLAECNSETIEDFMQEIDIQASMNPGYLDEMVRNLDHKLTDERRA